MAYPKKLSTTAELAIAPFVKKIERLKPGEGISINGSAGDIEKIRQHLYAWRFINGLDEITLRRDDLETLRITRRSVPKACILGEQHETKAQCFVRDHMLEIESEDDALERLRQACACDDLSTEDAQEALDEWRRIQG